jgi:superfamily II DNA or RNA helicase
VSVVDIITKIVNIPERNDFILESVKKLYTQERNIMILSERREHCFRLKEMITTQIGDVVGLYMGGMKQSDLDESEKKQIIIATYSLAHEGLDIPKLDSLILATPKSDVVQACGRILRETKGKKHNPYIIDIVDKIGLLMNQHRKRKTFYKKSGFDTGGKKQSEPEETTERIKDYLFIED